MIKGLFLALSLSIFLASLFLGLAGSFGLIVDNFVTGSVVGAKETASYSTLIAIFSFLLTLLAISLIFKKKSRF